MRIIAIVTLLLSTMLNGCGPHAFQPPRDTYERWTKYDATKLDVMKALLECGRPDPLGHHTIDDNEYVLSLLCMESLGYTYINTKSYKYHPIKNMCSQYPNLPACQPDAVIPKPSVERRLNSEYCQYAKSLIDPVEYQRCLKEDAANPLDRTTAENCAYWNKDLRAECRP